eukprot:TRINITY_DN789_c0_g2_i1.p1 TRINITY_DN789_c0_g2~~TRINITY_DN789_c0_g2_i1.p1  ORF type:complete len:667 (+),score=137.12 TRINITY_DN789_c0_g2_i1:944-2944(+)
MAALDLPQVVRHIGCLQIREAEALLRPHIKDGASVNVTALTLMAEVAWLRSMVTEDKADIKEATDRLDKAEAAALKGCDSYRGTMVGSLFRMAGRHKVLSAKEKMEELACCTNLAYIYLMEALALFRGSMKGYLSGAVKLKAAWRLYRYLGETELPSAMPSFPSSSSTGSESGHASSPAGSSPRMEASDSLVGRFFGGGSASPSGAAARPRRRLWSALGSTSLNGRAGSDAASNAVNAVSDEASAEKESAKDAETNEEWTRIAGDISYGVGGFHFFVSMVPGGLKYIVESLGFRGDRELGRRELQESLAAGGQRVASALLLILWMDTFFYKERANAEKLLERASTMFETSGKAPSPLFQFLGGYLARVQGHLDVAVVRFGKAKDAAGEIPSLQQMCGYEVGWCHYLRCDFAEAIRYFEPFMAEFKAPSYRAYCAYQLGCCLDIVGRTAEAKPYMASVAKLARNKNYPFDHYGARKAAQWLKAGQMSGFDKGALQLMNHLEAKNWEAALRALPGLRFFLMQNTIRSHKLTAGGAGVPGGASTEAEVIDVEEVDVVNDNSGYYQYCVGRTLRGLGKPAEAEEAFSKVVEKESLIKEETYILPYSYCEMGELQLEGDRLNEAAAIFKHIKAKFKDFDFDKPLFRRLKLAQDRLRVRLHAAGKRESSTSA